MDEPTNFLKLLSAFGGASAIAWVLWALLNNKLYLPREIEWRDKMILELKAARDKWYDTATTNQRALERLLETNEKAMAVAQSLPPPTSEAKT